MNDDKTESTPLTPELAAAKGFALLTAHGPDGWRQRVNIERLDMGHIFGCALGQVYGDFSGGARQLFLAAGLIGDEYARTNDLVRAYGFEAPLGSYGDGSAYSYLEELRQEWVALLTDGDHCDGT